MKSTASATRLALAAIVLAYLAVAVQYARLTPAWQAPDEPAHFNYARYVAEHGTLPVLQPGDYSQSYLEEIKGRKFPPEMSIDAIRYESWQPPLYYLLAAGVYRLAAAGALAQQLLALRLLSVVLGALLLLVSYRAVTTLAPTRPWLALGATALVATVPMHVAVSAAVSNDVLAELWVALVTWQLLALVRGPDRGLRPWLLLGITLGAAGLTKISTGITVPLVVAALGYLAWREPAGRGRALLGRLAAVGVPAVLMMLPWLVHNVSVYGPADPLVFARHDAVVLGQPRTIPWLQEVGLRRAVTEFVLTTFHSFWGQFGWMGVPIDERIYRGLAFMVALAALGLLLRLPSLPRDWRRLAPAERMGLALLAALTVLTGASLLWYNLSFKQHQGRYLFPALIPLGVFLSAGWREITRRGRRLLAAVLPLAAALLLAGRDALRHQAWDKWTVLGLTGLGGGFGLGAWLPEDLSRWLYALPYPLLLTLDLACLYAFILPALS